MDMKMDFLGTQKGDVLWVELDFPLPQNPLVELFTKLKSTACPGDRFEL
jgi:hypothetical protein